MGTDRYAVNSSNAMRTAPGTASRVPATRGVLLLLLAGLVVLPFWALRFLPFPDFQHWTFQAYLIRQALHGLDLASYYEVIYGPVPNSAFSVVALVLGLLPVSAEASGKVILTLAVLMNVAGTVYLARSIQRRPTILEFFPLIWSWSLFVQRGNLNYVLSLGLGFLTVGYLHRVTEAAHRVPGFSSLLVLSALSVATYLAHFAGWGGAAVAIVVYAICITFRRRTRSGWAVLATLLPTLVLLAWYVWRLFSHGGASPAEFYPSLRDKLSTLIPPLLLFFRIDPFDIQPVAPLLLNLGIVAATFILTLGCTNLARRCQVSSAVHPLPFVVALLCAATGLAIPFRRFVGPHRMDERFVLPALWTALASLKWRPLTSRQAAVATLVALAVLATHVLPLAQVQPKLVEIFEAASNAIPSGATVYCVTLRDPPIRNACEDRGWTNLATGIHALQWFDSYRFMAQGGVHAAVMGTANLRPMPGAESPPQLAVSELPRDQVSRLPGIVATDARGYSYVEIFGCEADVREAARLLAPAFKPVASGRNYAVLLRR